MVKEKYRFRKKTKHVAEDWPPEAAPEAPPLEELATRARYTGSAEHKDYPSFAGAPALRADASRCPPEISQELAQEVLEQAFVRGCISSDVEGVFPRYVWGWLEGQLYQARLINREQGWYKAWPIELSERPKSQPAGGSCRAG